MLIAIFQNFPQFIVIHTVKGLSIVNKAEIDVFLELSCFFDDPVMIKFDLWFLCLFFFFFLIFIYLFIFKILFYF